MEAERRFVMVELICPWCECDLLVGAQPRDEEQCPECLTTWRYEEDEVELALAA
jgi:hypothetical protein